MLILHPNTELCKRANKNKISLRIRIRSVSEISSFPRQENFSRSYFFDIKYNFETSAFIGRNYS